MSNILNNIKEVVRNGVEVQVLGNPQYGRYPVTVKDKTDSITSGWELVYRLEPSKYNGKARDPFGHFSELRIPNFQNFYSLIQQVYSQFKQGVNVEQRYDTNFAVYQPNEQLWFTCLDRKAGTSITITVTDNKSPFHMLYMNFFITMSMHNNQPYMVGYDSCFDQQTGVYTEKMNAFMLPRKKRFVPVTKHESGASTIKAQGTLTPDGLVQINEQATEIVYVQEMSNERKLLAGIYEKYIIEFVLEKADEFFQENNIQMHQNTQQQPISQAFGQPVKPQTQQENISQQAGQQMNQQQPTPQTQQSQNTNVFDAWMNVDTSGVF